MRVKLKPVFLSPNSSITASHFHRCGAWSTGILEAWALVFSSLPWIKAHFPASPGQQPQRATESTSAAALLILPCLEIPGGLALRGRALDMCLSFNQVGHVGRGAFLVVFLYFFVWPRVKHRTTKEHFYRGKKKRSMGFLLHLQRSVAWAHFYSGAHLIHVSSPSRWMCTGRLVANICFDKTWFPSEHSGLVQQRKYVLPNLCWYYFPSVKLPSLAGSGGYTSKCIWCDWQSWNVNVHHSVILIILWWFGRISCKREDGISECSRILEY